MKKAMIFLAAILISTLSHAAIIDGENVKTGEHPAVFGMVMNGTNSDGDDGESVCTAFLVAPNLLLTAAHCLQHTYSIGLIGNGTNLERNQKGTEVRADRFGANPAYVSPGSKSSDIGYITLRQAVTGITPLPVHVITDSASAMLLPELEVTLVGYGASRFRGINADYSDESRLVKKQGKKTINAIRQYYTIVMGEKNGALPGDSGGPQIAKIDGVAKVVALNHGIVGALEEGQRKKDQKYGATIGTLLTKANLCWVESESKVEIPGVDCSKK